MTTDTSGTTTPAPPTPRRRRRNRLALLLLAVVLLLAAGYGAAYAVAGGRTPAEASSLGVDIGGMEPAAAAQRLTAATAEQVSAPIPVRVAGAEHTVDPAAAGLGLDAAATVEATGARSWSPASIARVLFGGGDVAPVVAVDEGRLAAAVAALAERTDRPVREGDVTFDGARPVAVEPVTGVTLDREGAAAAIREAYLAADEPVELPTTETPPEVDAAEVRRALNEFARPAMAAPVTLISGGQRAGLPPARIAPALGMEPDDAGRLRPTLDAEVLKKSVARDLDEIERDPQDATIRMQGGRPVVVPSVEGRTLPAADLAAAVLPALTETGSRRLAEVATAVAQPDLTTAEAEALGVEEELSAFTQEFPYTPAREQNVAEAARRIDGTLLLPGETFSMNATTEERTVANGYTVGGVISNGRFREELGGGVSIITTAMWDAAFFAGLERVEQRAHSLYISRYKPGLEATVDWGALDLKFRNDSPHGVLIEADSGRDWVTIRMWGTKRYDVAAEFGPRTNVREPETVYDPSPECTPQSGAEGFDIVVTRVFRQDGEVVRREPLRTSYNVTNTVVCGSPPS